MKGARITVKCDCGQTNYLDYGERWECPQCHRRWNTAQIPEEEYWGLMREMRDARIKVMFASGIVGVGILVLATTVSIGLIVLLPIVMGGWYLVYMPRWRRRLREKARAAPNWTLYPE